MAIKEIPKDIYAEQSLLGSMMLSQVAIDKACEKLFPESFYDEKHQVIFKTIVDLHEKHVPIDVTIITSELNNNKKLNSVGGTEYISELMNTVPNAANVDAYINIVEDNYLLRNIITTATEISELAYNHEGEVTDVIDVVESKIVNIIKNRRSQDLLTIKEALNDFEQNLNKLASSKNEISGIPTNFTDFDRMTSGLHENQLIILAARPSVGKTALALNIATNVAIHSKKSVALFELEMGTNELVSRMVASLGSIDGRKLISGNLVNDDWVDVFSAKDQLANTNLFVSDDVGLTVGDIKSQCRRLATSEAGLDLVIIDHIQLLNMGTNYGNNRQAELTDISRNLKKMAKELKVPVIALSQLSRSVEKRDDNRPKMSDLRDSGAIEQDADVVMFLYRKDYQSNEDIKTQSNISPTELIVRKNRNGITGKIDLIFEKNTSTFKNATKRESNEGEK